MNAHSANTGGQKLFFGGIALSVAILVCSVSTLACSATLPFYPKAVAPVSTLPDLSGLAWVEDDLFIGIHDAKRNSDEYNWPRVTLVRLPESELDGVTWQSFDVKFPGGPSSDLESASPIPGGKGFLFAESGQEGKDSRRIFFATYNNGTLKIESKVNWPVPVENVEATEVCLVGKQLVFIYAERADSLPTTKLRWATLSLNPVKFGAFKEVTYEGVDPVGQGARPIVALAVDSDGYIYSVSAYDSGNDSGPFRSVVWRIGQMIADGEGNPQVELGEGERLGTLDALKVESIAVRESIGGDKQVYVGTDDEYYGGIVRLLPPAP
jgi:hypothetical protein